MADKMLVESDPHETRIAVLEEDRLTEIFLERHQHRGVVGNVYKGRVTRVLPGMQAAFVDLGLDRDAFLYVADVAPAVPPEIETELASTEDLLDETPRGIVDVVRSGGRRFEVRLVASLPVMATAPGERIDEADFDYRVVQSGNYDTHLARPERSEAADYYRALFGTAPEVERFEPGPLRAGPTVRILGRTEPR